MKIFVFILISLFGTYSFGANFFGSIVSGTATVTSTSVLAQNNLRNYLVIQNGGTNPIFVKFGSVQSGTEGIEIIGGGSYEPIEAPANSVFMRTATGSSAYTIIEGN